MVGKEGKMMKKDAASLELPIVSFPLRLPFVTTKGLRVQIGYWALRNSLPSNQLSSDAPLRAFLITPHENTGKAFPFPSLMLEPKSLIYLHTVQCSFSAIHFYVSDLQ